MKQTSIIKNLKALYIILFLIITLFVLTLFAFYNIVSRIRLANTGNENESLTFAEDLSQIDPSDLIDQTQDLEIDTNLTLSNEEVEDLQLMREEEKLAHDVYLSLYDRWNIQIFRNISESEQKHTDSVARLLSKYNLFDPASDIAGKFVNQNVQNLYTELVNRGAVSANEALIVGAMIEELDISDLEKAIGRTTNSDISLVYNNLQKGSRNHLRSFASALSRNGINYQPNYISNELYLNIISTAQEKGNMTKYRK